LIRPSGLLHLNGLFLMVLAGSMMVPLVYGLAAGSGGLGSFAIAVAVTAAAGAVLFRGGRRPPSDLSVREGILLVVTVWATACFFGCLPFWFSPHFSSFTDAFFESTSGFTTTGSTVLPRVEVLPPALQLWRCFTHWLGGMGIVLLGIAVLPLLGTGGMHLYRAEFSGAKSEKLRPRIAETVLALWKIYVALTLGLYVALRLTGMDRFESACHAFSTLGTGGFSTRTASIAEFRSPSIEAVLIVFMVLAGINFTMHYRLWVERRSRLFFGDPEIRAYAAAILLSTAAITWSLHQQAALEGWPALRTALFQVVSITTTTGFVTADYEQWLPLPQLLLLALMFSGGCTGSTAGGLKISRLVLLWRVISREFKRMVERRGVFVIRLAGEAIPETSIQALLNLVYLSFLINFTACLMLAAMGLDVLTSISAVAASMFNVGPGLGDVGPAKHYGGLPAPAKWVLSICMLAGRLEFYTLLVVLTPSFWRK